MLHRLKKLLEETAGAVDAHKPSMAQDELELACAALLVHASLIDGHADKSERVKIRSLLKRQFSLTDDEFDDLMLEAEREEHEAVDLYGFTSVLSRKLNPHEREKIVEMLWEIVYADGKVHEFEENLVWRVAELMHVTTRDRIRLKKAVEARQNSG